MQRWARKSLSFLSAALVLLVADAEAQGPGGVNAAPAQGERQPVVLWLAHTESSNIRRVTAGTRGAHDSVGAAFDLARSRQRLQVGLLGDLEYLKYSGDAAKDERIADMAAFLNTDIVPDHFTWSFRESYRTTRSNPFGADTPANRENVLIFSTRPQLDLPLGRRTTLALAGDYSDRKYDETASLDSKSLGYDAGVYRQIRTTTLVGLSAQTTEIDYGDAAVSYEIDALQLRYQRRLASGNASVSVGQNQLTLGDSRRRSPAYEVEWNRRLAARSTLAVTATRGFTDSGRLSEFDLDEIAALPDDVLLSQDATDRRFAGVDYTLALPRTSISLVSSVYEDDFAREDVLDSEGRMLGVRVRHDLTSRMSAGLGVDDWSRTYAQDGTRNDDLSIELSLFRTLGRSMDLQVLVRRSQRDGLDEFDENSYRIRLVFVPGRG